MVSLPTVNARCTVRTPTVTSWLRTSCCGDPATADLYRVRVGGQTSPLPCPPQTRNPLRVPIC
jgi:hypothetical protein